MKNKNYHTVGTVTTSNKKRWSKGANSNPLTYNYMTAHFPVLVHALQ